LQLRNEYDRAYLYRCIAAQVTASFGSSRPAAWLTVAERQAIAQRLEKFFHTFIHGGVGERTEQWKADVERRLEIKLTLADKPALPSGTHQLHDALRSLASYLVAVKEREGAELPDLLAPCHLLGRVGDEDRKRLLETLSETPPYFFEQPDLDPKDELTTAYLEDLIRLAAAVPPHTPASYQAALDAAAYFRHDVRAWQGKLTERSVEQVNDHLPASAPPVRMSLEAARTALALGGTEERWRFLVGGITLRWPPGKAPREPIEGRLWLLGLSDRMALFCSDHDETLWMGQRDVRIQRVSGMLIDGCVVSGGQWLGDQDRPPPELHVSGVMKNRFWSHFGPLWEFCQGEQKMMK
jgi:hypothetical protein